MGNQQSTANHDRLSRLQTNSNFHNHALQADSPSSVSSKYADLSAKGRQKIRETLLSPGDTDLGSAIWSDKDNGMGEPATQGRGRPGSVISRSNSRANSRSNSLSCFGSRHGSTTKLAGLSDSKTSFDSTSSVDVEAAVKLLQDVKRNASPEDLAALREASEPPEKHAVPLSEQELSRRNSIMYRSSSSLTRRRSLLQTPGVATRNSPVNGRRRTWNSWRAPKLDPEEESKWSAPSNGAPPLSRLAALQLIEASRDTTTPRAQTPGELDYSHLGSLKLGSLVVTNGAPSPAPSAKIPKNQYHHTGEDDYFSAAEACSDYLMMTTRRRGHMKSSSSVLRTTALLQSEVSLTDDERTETKPTHIQPHTFSNDRSSHARQETEFASQLRVTNKSEDMITHNANRLAQSYQADIPLSPFERPREGYNDMSDNVKFSKEEAAHILDSVIFCETAHTVKSTGLVVSPTTPRLSRSQTEGTKPSQRPPPRTADSGYSSGGSLRVANREQSKDLRPTVSAQRSHTPLKGDSAKTESKVNSDVSKQSASLVGCEQPSSATTHPKQANRKPSSLKIPDQPVRSSARPSTSGTLLSPQTPRSVASKASFDSTSSSMTQKRLQKRRPSQPELPVVQSCQPIPEGAIPDVPDNVRIKFARRLSHTPGMECLTHTYPTKDHVLANEPFDPPRLAATGISQLADLEPDQPPTPPAPSRRKSMSLFRRKSTTSTKVKEAGSETLDVVDLGTIASALGQSPYDAAMSGPLRKTITAPTHPHQLGNRLPRAKSMASMNSESAAEFARMRSKDRALAEQELPPRSAPGPHNTASQGAFAAPKPSPTQKRRRSYHNLKVEAGEAKAAKRRPQSSHHDVPPVPSVPHASVPRLESEVHNMSKSDLSIGARSRERGEVVSQLVDKYDHYEQPPSQHTVDWESHARAWSQRRKSIGEGLRTKNESAAASASTSKSRTMSQTPEDMAAWGRYSGGLGYNYEGRGVGIGGSAGTRLPHSSASNKSLHWRNQFGVDLSDVPLMFQIQKA